VRWGSSPDGWFRQGYGNDVIRVGSVHEAFHHHRSAHGALARWTNTDLRRSAGVGRRSGCRATRSPHRASAASKSPNWRLAKPIWTAALWRSTARSTTSLPSFWQICVPIPARGGLPGCGARSRKYDGHSISSTRPAVPAGTCRTIMTWTADFTASSSSAIDNIPAPISARETRRSRGHKRPRRTASPSSSA
jgi:hypothetical protein